MVEVGVATKLYDLYTAGNIRSPDNNALTKTSQTYTDVGKVEIIKQWMRLGTGGVSVHGGVLVTLEANTRQDVKHTQHATVYPLLAIKHFLRIIQCLPVTPLPGLLVHHAKCRTFGNGLCLLRRASEIHGEIP